MPRGSPNKHVLPRTRKLSPLCTPSLSDTAPTLPVPWGGLGGRSRIEFIVSPLPRRRHNESHFAAEPPKRAFLAKPFFARAKNGVNSGRRSHKISVAKSKKPPTPDGINNISFFKSFKGVRGGFFSKNPPAFLIHTLSNLPEPLADYVACRGYHDKSV